MSSEFTGALTTQMDNTVQMDSLFHYLPLDIIAQLMAYLCIDDWGRLDIALVYSHPDERRERWLQVLRSIPIDVKVMNNDFWSRRLAKGVLKWLIARGIKVTEWVSDCINDQQLMDIANGLPMLQVLNILTCKNISDAGVIAVANGSLTKLTTLKLLISDISDAGVIALANGNFKNITLLVIGYNKNITDAGVHAIANGN